MNFPYSKKWITVTVAAAVAITAGSVYAADNKTTANTAAATAATTTTETAAASTTAPAAAATTANGAANAAATTAETTAPAADSTQASAEAEPLSLDKAIAQALKTNKTLQSLRIQIDTANTNALLARNSARHISNDAIEDISQAQSKYSSPAQAESTKRVNALSLKNTENTTKATTQQMYYDLLNAQAQVELKKQSLTRSQEQLKVAEAGLKVGTKAKSDVLQAEMGVAQAQAALVSAENTLKTSMMKFNQYIGVDLNKKWVLSPENKQLQPISMSLQEATEKALKQRVEIIQAQEELTLAKLNYDIIAKYGSAVSYAGQKANNDIDAAELGIQEEQDNVKLDVAQAYYNLDAAKQTVEFTLKAKESAAENYRLTNLRFQNGLATTLDVIQAEEELSTQENNYQEALRDYNLAVVSFENSLGVPQTEEEQK
ncbi:TolC family protein [Brevibacillus fulvus]|uniref:TolC family protein n=1 Tax=Brevibacillus fulvus TaxID=1125967 RepID=A0A938XYR0_9BACL|nr:TolC family protein [Brevibacillus fulvus]MBM7590150.1 hypothetical protein [Brevibacillus fulvus]